MDMNNNDKRDIIRALGAVGNIGFSLAASILVTVFIGRWLDGLLGTSPLITVIGIILGVIAGLWSVYKQVTTRN
jgi:ATP synthase protein I